MADAQASGACGRKIVWVQVPSPALFFRFAYQELVRWTNSDCPDGKCENFPSGSFYFYAEKMCRRGKKNRRISDSVKLFKIIVIIHIFHKIKTAIFFIYCTSKNFSNLILLNLTFMHLILFIIIYYD